MIVSTVKGDLIQRAKEGHYNAIVQGCNCFCKMGAGIAKQIKNEFPIAYQVDCETEEGDRSKLGDFTVATVYIGNAKWPVAIVNAYTQYDTATVDDKSPVDYGAIAKVFIKINEDFTGEYIGIPKIGAGLAGGDWNIIKTLIDAVTPDVDIELVEWDQE